MTKRRVENGTRKGANTADTPTAALGLEPWNPNAPAEAVGLATLLLRALVDCNSDVVGGALGCAQRTGEDYADALGRCERDFKSSVSKAKQKAGKIPGSKKAKPSPRR